MRVLIVEDQSRAAQELLVGLASAGFSAEAVGSAEAAQDLLEAGPVDALVVDVMLPGLSGLAFVRRLRDHNRQVPVLFLSARGALEDRLKGLEAGGDDYLAKPYSILEVVARLKAIARRPQGQGPPRRLQVADLAWDPVTRRISRGGERLDLTPKEYAIMTLLLEHAGQVVPRSQLVQVVWGLDCAVDPNAVDVQILRLRRKVDGTRAQKLIHTIRGVGLLLEARGEA